MWGVVIGTLMIFALGILASAWILYATDPGKVGHRSGCITSSNNGSN